VITHKGRRDKGCPLEEFIPGFRAAAVGADSLSALVN
jgi:hypothetical protein